MYVTYEFPIRFTEDEISETTKQFNIFKNLICSNAKKGAKQGAATSVVISTIEGTEMSFTTLEGTLIFCKYIFFGGIAGAILYSTIGLFQFGFKYLLFKSIKQPTAKKELLEAREIFEQSNIVNILQNHIQEIHRYFTIKNNFLESYREEIIDISKLQNIQNVKHRIFNLINQKYLTIVKKQDESFVPRIERKISNNINYTILSLKNYLMTVKDQGKFLSKKELREYPNILQILDSTQEYILLSDDVYKRPLEVFFIKLETLMEKSTQTIELNTQILIEKEIEEIFTNNTNTKEKLENALMKFTNSIVYTNNTTLKKIITLATTLINEMKDFSFIEPRYILNEVNISQSEQSASIPLCEI